MDRTDCLKNQNPLTTWSMLLFPLPLAPVTKLTLWLGFQVNWEWHMKFSMYTCKRNTFSR